MKTDKKYASVFELNGMPKFSQAFPLALQHVVAMIVGCVTPAIVIAGVAGLEGNDKVIFVQAALFIAAISTLIQLFPLGGKIGSGLPVIMGVSFAYLPSMQAIAGNFDIATILGAQLIGGIVAVFVGIFVIESVVSAVDYGNGCVYDWSVIVSDCCQIYGRRSIFTELWCMAELACWIYHTGSCNCAEPFCKRNFETCIYFDWYDCRIYCVRILWHD